MEKPKILVGCPTSEIYSYCISQYAEAVKSLKYPNYDVLLVDNSETNGFTKKIKELGINVIKGPYHEDLRERVIASRNLLRQHALENNYDYFLSLEQDVIPPEDIIQTLLNHKKPITSGVYFKPINFIIEKQGKHIKKITRIMPLLIKDDVKELEVFSIALMHTSKDVMPNKVLKVRACGLGCVLISREVLEKIKFRYGEKAFDDVAFSNDAYSQGYEIFADTSIKCKHLVHGKPKDIYKDLY